MMKKSAGRWLAVGLLAGSAVVSAWAADHAGDVAVSAREGQLKLGGQRVEIQASTGFNIYRADLSDLFHGPWATSNPGFQTQGSERLKPGVEIGFEGLGALSFWDGVRWSGAAAGTELRVSDYLEADSIWTGAGVTHGASQMLGEVSASGKLHEHLVFSVTEGAALGAYQITLRLSSPDYGSSDPFHMVLNRGLSTPEFQRARVALMQASVVPEPASAGLFLIGILALGLLRARRKSRPPA
ncbi:PEP-CTERM sorting domain-containing protein [Roseateles sp.]|uniref:PEP-CTERM sorting domain-containing protein n=1 Tax=Roseateles sp. TaxID=1971397 RepID=UPI003BA6CA9B